MKNKFTLYFVIISLLLSLMSTTVSAGVMSWLLRKEAGVAERAVVREGAGVAERASIKQLEKEMAEQGISSSERALLRGRIAGLTTLSAAEILAAETILGRVGSSAAKYQKYASAAGRAERNTAIRISSSSGLSKIINNGYKFEKDSLGRPTRVTGKLKLSGVERKGDYQAQLNQKTAGGSDRLMDDHGGHLIGDRFEGASEKYNLVAMNGKLNQGEYKSMENLWAKALQDGRDVNVDIKPIFSGKSMRPDKIVVKYNIDGMPTTRIFNN